MTFFSNICMKNKILIYCLTAMYLGILVENWTQVDSMHLAAVQERAYQFSSSHPLTHHCSSKTIQKRSPKDQERMQWGEKMPKSVQAQRDYRIQSRLNRLAKLGSTFFVIRCFPVQCWTEHYYTLPSSDSKLSPLP